jgi:hypothetical protein
MHPRRFQKLLSYIKDDANCFTIPINFNMDVDFVPKCVLFEEHYHEYTGRFRPGKRAALGRTWHYDPQSIQYWDWDEIKQYLSKFPSLGDLMFVGGCPPLQRKVSQYGDLIEIEVRFVPQKNQSQGSPPQRQLKVEVMNLNKT